MFLAFVGLVFITLRGARYEAEDGKLSGSAEVLTAKTGYSGRGYVEFHDDGGVEITADVSDAGYYNLVVGFFGVYGDKKQNLAVNGESLGEIAFPETASFEEIVAAKKLNLKKGSNTIAITASWGWQIIDYIELAPYEDSAWNISAKLVNPKANAQAVELYEFLKANFLKKYISGVMTLQGTDDTSLREPKWLQQHAGKYPALLGLDFMRQVGKGEDWYYNDATLSHQVVRDASDWYSRGGIPALMWHWRDPSNKTAEFYSPSSGNTATDFDASKAADPSTTEYQQIITELDVIAQQLLDLQSKGVAVLWRPFHEASGKWFWWGYKGPEALKKLWQIEYDRFTNHHGLNNLIWVWTSDTAADALEWYPGDQYVDIVGADLYPSAGDHNSQVGTFEALKDLFKARKIIALTESGPVPDPDKVVADGAWWSYFMPWYGDYTIPQGGTPQNSESFWQSAFKNPAVLTLDQMPGWKAK